VFAREIGAPQRHGHDLCPAGDERIAHQFVGTELAGADEQPRRELAVGDLQLGGFVGHRVKVTQH
jgi:hypothetical protein